MQQELFRPQMCVNASEVNHGQIVSQHNSWPFPISENIVFPL